MFMAFKIVVPVSVFCCFVVFLNLGNGGRNDSRGKGSYTGHRTRLPTGVLSSHWDSRGISRPQYGIPERLQVTCLGLQERLEIMWPSPSDWLMKRLGTQRIEVTCLKRLTTDNYTIPLKL